jgi:hypothetical protein
MGLNGNQALRAGGRPPRATRWHGRDAARFDDSSADVIVPHILVGTRGRCVSASSTCAARIAGSTALGLTTELSAGWATMWGVTDGRRAGTPVA